MASEWRPHWLARAAAPSLTGDNEGVPKLTRRIHPSRIGALVLTARNDALSGVFWPDHPVDGARALLGETSEADPFLREVGRQLDEYLVGERTDFHLPLVQQPRSELEAAVWQQISRIGYGSTRSYGQLARELGDPHLAQAVGGATGHNPISIVVPCHRVVGSDGSWTGFAGGTARKAWLLGLEAWVSGDTLFGPSPGGGA